VDDERLYLGNVVVDAFSAWRAADLKKKLFGARGSEAVLAVSLNYGTHRWRTRWSEEVTTIHDRKSN
jgi:hypothetical protein